MEPLPKTHFYVFSDASPSDWLTDGGDENWHTIVNLLFQTDPSLIPCISGGRNHEDVLSLDRPYQEIINNFNAKLPNNTLRKWHRSSMTYKKKFCEIISEELNKGTLIISACSFQEKTLRNSQTALLNSYNQNIGGIEGRNIDFELFDDKRGRRQMRHSFINFHGHHEIQAPESQMLVLLFMAWFFANQFIFFSENLVLNENSKSTDLAFTVVSDKLSGDDEFRPKNEMNLRNLIDPDGDQLISLGKSQQSDSFSGDLIVDNLAGLLNSAVDRQNSETAELITNFFPNSFWQGWHRLMPSETTLKSIFVKETF
ncbi:MAG: hypothetical protein KC553_05180 [Nitrospina sp.]|nr:hypothetical protein [Nitrospina sp.]